MSNLFIELQSGLQVLINAQTGQVGSGTQVTGNPTNLL